MGILKKKREEEKNIERRDEATIDARRELDLSTMDRLLSCRKPRGGGGTRRFKSRSERRTRRKS